MPALRKARLDAWLNRLLLLTLLAAAGVFAAVGQNTYTYTLALAGLALAAAVQRRWRWGYFAAAAWALACYQLAKEGLAFEPLKRAVMIAAVPVIVLALYLHDALTRRRELDRDNSD